MGKIIDYFVIKKIVWCKQLPQHVLFTPYAIGASPSCSA